MDVITGDNVIEHCHLKSLFAFYEPPDPISPVRFKIKKKIRLMAPLGYMPDITQCEISVCSWHGGSN
jgi:hypothetical protein